MERTNELPKIAIVIVVWNGLEDTLECIQSLAKDRYPNKELVLVDNGSSDGSAEAVRKEWPGVHVVALSRNAGFTGGNNAGLTEAFRLGAKYAFLLNNDTTVEPDALSALVECAQREPGAAILAPVTHYYDAPGEVWFSGAVLDLARGEAVHQPAGARMEEGAAYPSPWVTGCAMLVRLIAVELVGGLDDRFFLTWEDVDWCVRMREEGWEVLVVPSARIFHKCSRATRRLGGIRCYYAVRNSLLLAQKHAGLAYWSALGWVVWNHFRESCREVAGERARCLAVLWEGLRDHWMGRYGCRPAALDRMRR